MILGLVTVLRQNRTVKEVISYEICNNCCKETKHELVIVRISECKKEVTAICLECNETFNHIDFI